MRSARRQEFSSARASAFRQTVWSCSGSGEIDQSLITGETAPASIAPGGQVYAGTLNLGSALTVK